MNSHKFYRTIPFFLLTLFLLISHTPAYAIDRWAEQQLAQQISQQQPADSTWLKTPNKNTFALHRQTSRRDIQGGIIILHDIGTHPDQSGLIHQLRTQLPRHGWSSLSIQMPHIKDKNDPTELAQLLEIIRPRILAAIRFFKERNIINLALLGQGSSANLGLAFLVSSDNIDTDITAFIGIGLSHEARQTDWRNIETTLSRSKIPVLDIYAELDKPTVTDTTAIRLAAAQLAGARNDKEPKIQRTQKVKQLARNKTDNLRYRQIMVQSANPAFDAHIPVLIKRVRSWLKVYAAGRKIPVK